MICSNCGNEIDEFLNDEMVCPYCHEDINSLAKGYNVKKNNKDYINENTNENAQDYPALTTVAPSSPISAISFMLMQILFIVPVLNLLFLFIFSFKENINRNRKAFARSILAWYALLCTGLLSLVVAMLILKYPLDITFWFNKLKDYINNLNF